MPEGPQRDISGNANGARSGLGPDAGRWMRKEEGDSALFDIDLLCRVERLKLSVRNS